MISGLVYIDWLATCPLAWATFSNKPMSDVFLLHYFDLLLLSKLKYFSVKFNGIHRSTPVKSIWIAKHKWIILYAV